jgi:hypothetical protein
MTPANITPALIAQILCAIAWAALIGYTAICFIIGDDK